MLGGGILQEQKLASYNWAPAPYMTFYQGAAKGRGAPGPNTWPNPPNPSISGNSITFDFASFTYYTGAGGMSLSRFTAAQPEGTYEWAFSNSSDVGVIINVVMTFY